MADGPLRARVAHGVDFPINISDIQYQYIDSGELTFQKIAGAARIVLLARHYQGARACHRRRRSTPVRKLSPIGNLEFHCHGIEILNWPIRNVRAQSTSGASAPAVRSRT
jgi:hypothetical protein